MFILLLSSVFQEFYQYYKCVYIFSLLFLYFTSSTNKTDCHDITDILLKVALNAITLTIIHILLLSSIFQGYDTFFVYIFSLLLLYVYTTQACYQTVYPSIDRYKTSPSIHYVWLGMYKQIDFFWMSLIHKQTLGVSIKLYTLYIKELSYIDKLLDVILTSVC